MQLVWVLETVVNIHSSGGPESCMLLSSDLLSEHSRNAALAGLGFFDGQEIIWVSMLLVSYSL